MSPEVARVEDRVPSAGVREAAGDVPAVKGGEDWLSFGPLLQLRKFRLRSVRGVQRPERVEHSYSGDYQTHRRHQALDPGRDLGERFCVAHWFSYLNPRRVGQFAAGSRSSSSGSRIWTSGCSWRRSSGTKTMRMPQPA